MAATATRFVQTQRMSQLIYIYPQRNSVTISVHSTNHAERAPSKRLTVTRDGVGEHRQHAQEQRLCDAGTIPRIVAISRIRPALPCCAESSNRMRHSEPVGSDDVG